MHCSVNYCALHTGYRYLVGRRTKYVVEQIGGQSVGSGSMRQPIAEDAFFIT